MRVMRVNVDTEPPASFFSSLRATAIGLSIGATLVVGLLTYNWLAQRLTPDPSTAPACYGLERATYTPPRDATIPLRGAHARDGTSIDQRRDESYRVTEAETTCNVTECSTEAAKKYRSAWFWYLSSRLTHTRRLDMDYGQLGLRRAAEIYSEPIDIQLEKGLRERYRAGVFRINDFTQNRDAIAILVLKGGAALRPCRKVDVAS
jgi:hypothetical protein